jgi:hypothetical protein
MRGNWALAGGVVRSVITRIAKLRYFRLAAFAIGGVAVAGAAVLVTASAAGLNVGFRAPSTSQPTQADTSALTTRSGKGSALCTDFISHFAGDLNTSPDKVNSAFQKAIGQTLADEVKNGALTQTQADAITKRLAGKAPCSLAAGLGKPSADRTKIAAYMAQLEGAAASALGISDAQLKTDLAQGMTLSQIAAAQHPAVTEAQFRTRLITNLTPLLDAAVKNQQLTAAQEQAILKRLQTGPIPFWSKPLHKAAGAAPASSAASN